MLDIRHTNKHEVALRLRDQGFEPIECAFGQYGSVLGRLCMDHHGEEAHRDGVALRACRDLYGERASDPRFVVTGTPDADATLAIVALSASVPEERIPAPFYELVDHHDVDPIGLDLLAQGEHGLWLCWFNQQSDLFQNSEGFRKAVEDMSHLLFEGLDDADRQVVRKRERNRRRKALDGAEALYDGQGERIPVPGDASSLPLRRGDATLSGDGRVLVVRSPVWGFDQWYRVAPVVVSYASRMAKVTVGCPDPTTARRLFGPEGLTRAWRQLGRGWGGRETIGGSPRGQRMRVQDAHDTARALVDLLIE